MNKLSALDILRHPQSGDESDIKEAIVYAISALEKQILKKPIKKNSICYAKTIDGQEYYAFDYFCPNCNEQIKRTEHHCICGQALDWSDTDA